LKDTVRELFVRSVSSQSWCLSTKDRSTIFPASFLKPAMLLASFLKKSLFFVFRPSSAELMVIIDGCVVLRQSRGDK
jgi:hypothetical protein